MWVTGKLSWIVYSSSFLSFCVVFQYKREKITKGDCNQWSMFDIPVALYAVLLIISTTYAYFFKNFNWKFYFFCSLSNMFLAIFSIVFAMGLVSVESSTVQSPFEVAMRCTKKGWEADMDALSSGPVTEEEILEDACIYLRVSTTEYLYITSIYQLFLRYFLSFLKRRTTTKK